MYENLMSLKHKIIIFLCTALNFAAATTQETQTDPLPGIHTLPTAQPISFSGAVISQALKAVQIREQALRTEILNEEEKGRIADVWMFRMDVLKIKEKQLGIEGDFAVLYVSCVKHLEMMSCSHESEMLSEFPHYYRCWLKLLNDSSPSLSEENLFLVYVQSIGDKTAFLGRAQKQPNQFRLRIFSRYITYGKDKYFLEPVEGEYHVDDQGRMMPVFTLVAEKKTEEEMHQY